MLARTIRLMLASAALVGLATSANATSTSNADRIWTDMKDELTGDSLVFYGHDLHRMNYLWANDRLSEYDLDEHRYRMIRPTTKAEQDQGLDEVIETAWFELPRRIRIEAVYFDSDRDGERNGKHRIEFSPTGEVIGHMTQLVSADIVNENRNKYTVELNGITGLVTYSRQEKTYAPVRDEFEFR